MEPTEFGDYLLLKKLAAGGMGEVFLARQLKGAGFERYVAIKRILPDLSGDDEFVRMFLDEARLAAQLNHPNVVEIHDLGICGDQYYIAMEFLEGRDLRRVMSRLAHRRRALPGAHAIQVIYNAAEGLHYAHELTDPSGTARNIIHRDVSPQNIFITFDGSVKVLDFGIAKAETRSVRTRTGGLKGKYPYMSPEQVRGEAVDRRSDIFSLGVILWEVTVGRRLFRRDNDLLTLNAVLKCDVPRPSSLMDRYPPGLEHVVMRALAKDPAARYETCRGMQEDLEAFMADQGLVLSPQKLGRSARRLFADEPATVKDILESLKEKPQSKSLLRDEQDPGSGRSGPARRPDESSETSSPSPGGRREPSSESIPGLGRLPPVGFEGADGSSSSSPSPSSSVRSHVNVVWTAEAEAADELEEDVEVDVDAAALDAEGDASRVTPSSVEEEVPPAEPWVSPSGVVDVGRLAAAASGSFEALGSADEPPPEQPAAAPLASVAEEPPAAAAGRGAPDRWIANAPTMVRSLADVEQSGHAPRAHSADPAAALPDLDGTVEEWTVTTEPRSLRPPEAVAASRRRSVLLVAAAAGAALLLFVVAAIVVVCGGTQGGAGRDEARPPAGAPPPSRPAAGRPASTPPSGPSIATPTGPPEAGLVALADAAAPVPAPPSDAGGPEEGASVDALGEAGPPARRPDAAAPELTPPPAVGPPRVPFSLSTNPSGLAVYLGGRFLGTSPVKTLVEPGRHTVRLRSKAAGIDHSADVTVPSGAGCRESIVVPQGELALRVRPWAEVFVDGRRLGLTPMPPVTLYAGRHQVRLVNSSLDRTVTRSVTIRQGRRATLDVDLSSP